MSGISALVKETPEISFCHARLQREVSRLQTGGGSSPESTIRVP